MEKVLIEKRYYAEWKRKGRFMSHEIRKNVRLGILAAMLMTMVLLCISMPVSAASKKPAKVTIKSATMYDENKILIKWKKVKNATKYRIYWKKAGAKKWKVLSDVKGSKSSYIHVSSKKCPLKIGGKYSYTVRAYNKKGKKWGSYNKKGITMRMLPILPEISDPVDVEQPETEKPGKSTDQTEAVRQPEITNPSDVSKQPEAQQPTVTPDEPKSEVKITELVPKVPSCGLYYIGDRCSLVPEIYPSTATNKKLIWKSFDENIVKVDKNGYATAVGFGETTVSVTTTDGSDITIIITVIVQNYHNLVYKYNDGTNNCFPLLIMDGTLIHTSDHTYSREGYEFDGWYTEAEGGTLVTSFIADRDITLYAHWVKRVDDIKATNVYLEGSQTYNCSIRDEDVDASVDIEQITMEVIGNTGAIGDMRTLYESNEYITTKWIGFRAQRSGHAQIKASYNGKVLKIWNITVTTDWKEYVGYVNWRRSVENSIWKDSMSVKEKLDAAQNYIKTNFTYQLGYCQGVLIYEDKMCDCIGAADIMGAFAKDIGCTVGYVNMYTDTEYDYLVDAVSAAGGHIFTVIKLDGNWVSYDAQPMHS